MDKSINTAIQIASILADKHILPQNDNSTPAILAASLFAADFKAVLLSDQGKHILSLVNIPHVPPCPPPTTALSTSSQQELAISSLIVGVACLQAFIQQNWTGPDLSFSSTDLFSTITQQPEITNASQSFMSSEESLHVTSIALLALDGEPAYHLARTPVLLLLAIRIFASLDTPINKGIIPLLPWWILRATLVHQSLLDEPVPLPLDLLPRLSAPPLQNALASYPDLQAALSLEIGLAHHLLSQDKLAQECFIQAAKYSGLEYELTGALGKRTKFQVDEISQLVLLAISRDRPDEDVAGNAIITESTETPRPNVPQALLLNDDTLLENTEFNETDTSPFVSSAVTDRLKPLNPSDQPPLHPLDQSLLLSLCLAQHNTSPENGLTASQMSPYLDRVLSHPRNWSVHTTALLLRARLESTRSRTVERSALQLQALVDQMPTADSAVDERLKFFYQLPLPSKWQMEKELAKRYLSLGVVKSAMEIFERLEMWEEVVKCLTAIERSDRAVVVVRDLLDGKIAEADIVLARLKLDEKEKVAPVDQRRRRLRMDKTRAAKLWCLLGDLEVAKAEDHYLHAWDVSAHTSSRAQRSLGALYLARDDFARAIPCFQEAVKINPLYARTWFALGCCLVREERWREAMHAFSRDVAIEEEDGEGWNNLAAVYLRMGDRDDEEDSSSPKAVPFANKQSAFRALQQGLRFSRENWRMWQNYMIVAMDVGELSEAARALSRIVEERAGKEAAAAVDEAVLSKLVDAVTREDWNGGKRNLEEGAARTSNEGHGLLPIVERLFDVVILPRVSDSPRVYSIQARLFRWKTDWAAALGCYLKAYRCGAISSDSVERDVSVFREAVEEIGELVTIMEHLGPLAKEQEERAGLVKGQAKWSDWKFQARSLVRTLTGRVKDSFEDEAQFGQLADLLQQIRSA